MRSYVARRLWAAGLTLFVLSFVVFFLFALRGDSVEGIASAGLSLGEEPSPARIAEVRRQLGFDRPLLERYGRWLGRVLQGDLGSTFVSGRSVGEVVGSALPATAALALAGTVLVIIMAIPFGTIAALHHGRWPDALFRLLALSSASVPGFFLAYILVYVAAVRLKLLPVAGTEGLRSLVLPALTVAVGPAALVSRLLRSSLLEVLGESYITTGRAKGLAVPAVTMRHALRNAALPVLTVLGGTLARLLEGTIVAEIVFSRSGVGLLTYQAIASGDYALVQATVLLAGVVIITLNLVVDLSYSLVDPRVRLGART